jgi:hypothetical protein
MATKSGGVPAIACKVGADLFFPPNTVAFSPAEASGAAMPEATVDEYDQVVIYKHEVGATG